MKYKALLLIITEITKNSQKTINILIFGEIDIKSKKIYLKFPAQNYLVLGIVWFVYYTVICNVNYLRG